MLMYYMQRFFEKFRNREEGAGLAEYALLLALIAVVCILALTTLGQNIRDVFDAIAAELVPATP